MVVGDIVSEVDVLVIGGGLAGYTAAIRAAQLGKEVTLIERGKLGGVCLNEGCIPSKALLTASQRFYQIKEAEHMGVRVRGGMELDFPAMQKWKNSIITQLQQGVAKLLKENHVTVVKGEAFFSAENEVRVTSEYRSEGFRFNHCIIATGSSVKRPESFPRHSSLITYAEALHLQEVPERFLVLGGGYIGIELATAYRKLGSEVIIVSTEDRLLPDFDVSLARMVARRLKKLGIEICLQARDLQLMEDGDRIKACARINEEVKEWRCDKVMFDEERLPNTDQLGLDFANVKTDGEGFILVDEQQRTSNPNIYAAGDVVGKPMLAHKGCYEGKIAAEAIAGKTTGNDATVIPRII